MTVGIILIVGAVCLTVYNIYDSGRADKAADMVMDELKSMITAKPEVTTQAPSGGEVGEHEGETPDYVTYPEMPMPTVTVEERRYIGYIEIPALGLTLPVAGEDWDYAILAKTPCLYSGSVYTDNAIIAGHNYTSHFGRLTRLPKGAVVNFVDAAGNVFFYEVAWTETIVETDIEGMESGDDWDMSLFTCNYAGDKRFTVRLVRR